VDEYNEQYEGNAHEANGGQYQHYQYHHLAGKILT